MSTNWVPCDAPESSKLPIGPGYGGTKVQKPGGGYSDNDGAIGHGERTSPDAPRGSKVWPEDLGAGSACADKGEK